MFNAITFYNQTPYKREIDRAASSPPSVFKKQLKRRKFKLHVKKAASRTIGTQTVNESINERIQKVLHGKYSAEFYRVLDLMIDCHGSFETQNAIFMIKK